MEELIKKSNKYLIIYLLVGIVGSFVPLIPGAFLLDSDSNSVFGIILMILSGVILISSTVIYSLVGPKLTRQINEERAKRDLVKLQTKTGNRIYKTLNGEEIEFGSDFFTVDGKIDYYDKYSCLAYFRLDKKVLIGIAVTVGLTIVMGYSQVLWQPDGETNLYHPEWISILEELICFWN